MQDRARGPSGAPPRPSRTGIERAALSAVARGETTLAAAYDVRPSELATLRGVAALLASGGRDDLARTLLEGAAALDDRDAWTLRALAALHLRQGTPRLALDAATRVHALAAGGAAASTARRAADAEAALLAARAAVALGRTDDARTWLGHALVDRAAPPAVKRAARAMARRLG